MSVSLSRREALKVGAAGVAAATLPVAAAPQPFRLRYILNSAMYGPFQLDDILPEIAKTGSEAIDIWCKPHGTQREQIDAMGLDAFEALLKKHGAKVGMFTRYPLGPFRLQDEMNVAKRFGASIVLCGARGPKNLTGPEAKKGVAAFFEQMKPHLEVARETGVKIAIENHANSLLFSPDSMRAFGDLNPDPKHIGVAFAPHHCHTFADEIPALIEHLGASVAFVYAQEHGLGSKKKLPDPDMLKQLPGFGGGLDYVPVIRALRKIDYQGWIQPFAHPVPRGIPMLPSLPEVTAAINFSRAHLERCLRTVLES